MIMKSLNFRPETRNAQHPENIEKTDSKQKTGRLRETLVESLRRISKPVKIAILAATLAVTFSACSKPNNTPDAGEMKDAAENEKTMQNDTSPSSDMAMDVVMPPDAGMDMPTDSQKETPVDMAMDKTLDTLPKDMSGPEAPMVDFTMPLIAFYGVDVPSGGWQYSYTANKGGLNTSKVSPTAGKTDPEWSPDGKKIAFGGTTVSVMNYPSGGATTDIVASDGQSYYQPTWSPDGTKIAYTHRKKPDAYTTQAGYVELANSDGSGMVTKLFTPSDITDETAYTPSWSPDGKQIAFVTLKAGLEARYRLYTVNPDASGLTMLRDNTQYDSFYPGSVAYSPDGKTFYMTENGSPFGSKLGIYSVPVASPSDMATTINTTATQESDIVFSPDGTKVAYSVDFPSGCCDYKFSNIDGSGEAMLIPHTSTLKLKETFSWNPLSASK